MRIVYYLQWEHYLSFVKINQTVNDSTLYKHLKKREKQNKNVNRITQKLYNNNNNKRVMKPTEMCPWGLWLFRFYWLLSCLPLLFSRNFVFQPLHRLIFTLKSTGNLRDLKPRICVGIVRSHNRQKPHYIWHFSETDGLLLCVQKYVSVLND